MSSVFNVVSVVVAMSVLSALVLLRAWIESKARRQERIPVPVLAEQEELRRQRSARPD